MHPLLKKIPKEQIKEVYSGYYTLGDIDDEFIGFTTAYENLSKIIPRYWTVIDLGCAYNPQCYYFDRHKRYISVDVSDCPKFKSKNCDIYQMRINEFINEKLKELNLCLEETFIISNYVPCSPQDNKLIRETFPNLFVYYPHGTRRNFDFAGTK